MLVTISFAPLAFREQHSHLEARGVDALEVFRLMPLSEASIEGYHAAVAKACARVHAGQIPYIFAELRMTSNLDRLKKWCSTAIGKEVVCFEWMRYKRVLRLSNETLSPKMTKLQFRQLFYRLRAEAVGPVHTLSDSWALRMGPSPRERGIANKLRHELVASCIEAGRFHTVAKADGQLQCFQVLKLHTGREKLVNTGNEMDLRDVASVLVHDIWRQSGQALGGELPGTLTVCPQLAPVPMVVWSLCETFGIFRDSLKQWSPKVSDTEGCWDLHDPTGVFDGYDTTSDDCPVILMLEELRNRGWVPRDGLVKHTLDTKAGFNDRES